MGCAVANVTLWLDAEATRIFIWDHGSRTSNQLSQREMPGHDDSLGSSIEDLRDPV